MRYCCTSGHKITIKEEQSPFSFPSCSQTLAHLQWWKAQKKNIIKRRKKIYKDQQNKITLQFSNILQKSHVSYFKLYNIEQILLIIFILKNR